MAIKRFGLTGRDGEQDRLEDKRHGAYDPVSRDNVPDTNQQSSHELSQVGADVRGEPTPAGPIPMEDYSLPEGLKRERKGPLDKSKGRGEKPTHVP